MGHHRSEEIEIRVGISNSGIGRVVFIRRASTLAHAGIASDDADDECKAYDLCKRKRFLFTLPTLGRVGDRAAARGRHELRVLRQHAPGITRRWRLPLP